MYSSIYINDYDITQTPDFMVTKVDYISRGDRKLEINSKLFEKGSILSRVDDGEKKITIEGIFSGTSRDRTFNNRANLLARIDSDELIDIQIPYENLSDGLVYYRNYEGILERDIYSDMLGGQLNMTLQFVVPDGYGKVNNNRTSTSSSLTDVVAEMPTPVKSTYSLTGLVAGTEYIFSQYHGPYTIAFHFVAGGTTAEIVFDHINKEATLDGLDYPFVGEFYKVSFISGSANINASGATHTVLHEWDSWVR